MAAWSLAVSLVVSLVLAVACAAVGSGLLGSFFGVFVGVLTGYCLLIAVPHFFCLFLPKFGIGTDPRADTRGQ